MGDVLCGGERSAESLSAALRCKGGCTSHQKTGSESVGVKRLGFRKMKITILI